MVKQLPVWKPVQIDGSFLSGDTNGLICIEECTTYDENALKTNSKNKRAHVDDEDKDEEKVFTKKTKKKAKTQKSKTEQKKITLLPSLKGCDGFEVEPNTNMQDMIAWNIVPLPENILKALCEQSFFYPTQIQLLTLPAAILGKRDILGAAETGSGKTLAFGLPILSGILKEKSQNQLNKIKPLYALILTPTRELAMQVKNHLTLAAKYTGIKIALVVGGMAAVKQERMLNYKPEIVIGTPGRLWELIQQGNEHLSQLNNIKFLAIDETDRMLEKGHFQELYNILEKLNLDEEKKVKRQNFVFSATLTLIHELPKHLLSKKRIGVKKKVNEMTSTQKLQQIIDTLGITNPKIVDITKGIGTSETLTECRISCTLDEKDFYVYYFLKRHPGRTLIFCNSIGCVKRLGALLSVLNFNPVTLHASLQQRQRLKNLDKFKEKENAILIATDVAARGLDIPCVEHVLHYQTPRTTESYVHRSGRTARASRQGITILLVEPNELPNYLRLCRTLGKGEDLPLFPVDDTILESVKKRVVLAREIDKLRLLLQKTNSEAGWLEKAAKDMDIIVDEITAKYDKSNSKQYQKQIDIKNKELMRLLSMPLFPKDFSFRYPFSSGEKHLPLIEGKVSTEKAVDVMKEALKTSTVYGRKRTKPKALFKTKMNNFKNNGKIVLKKKRKY